MADIKYMSKNVLKDTFLLRKCLNVAWIFRLGTEIEIVQVQIRHAADKYAFRPRMISLKCSLIVNAHRHCTIILQEFKQNMT